MVTIQLKLKLNLFRDSQSIKLDQTKTYHLNWKPRTQAKVQWWMNTTLMESNHRINTLDKVMTHMSFKNNAIENATGVGLCHVFARKIYPMSFFSLRRAQAKNAETVDKYTTSFKHNKLTLKQHIDMKTINLNFVRLKKSCMIY